MQKNDSLTLIGLPIHIKKVYKKYVLRAYYISKNIYSKKNIFLYNIKKKAEKPKKKALCAR